MRMVLSRKLKLPKIKKEYDIPMVNTENTSEIAISDNKNEEKPMLSKNNIRKRSTTKQPQSGLNIKKYIKDCWKNWSNVQRKKLKVKYFNLLNF